MSITFFVSWHRPVFYLQILPQRGAGTEYRREYGVDAAKSPPRVSSIQRLHSSYRNHAD
jgi:hypothetical protein